MEEIEAHTGAHEEHRDQEPKPIATPGRATASGTITAEEDGYCTRSARGMSQSDLGPARWDGARSHGLW
jgi:hypothetical protein